MPVPVEVVTVLDDRVVEHARATLEQSLPAELRDDRFAEPWVLEVRASGAPFVAAMCGERGGPLGFLGGPVQRGRLRLEAIVAPTEDHDEAQILDGLLRAVLPHGPRTGADVLELWAHPAWPFHEAVALAHELIEVRALHQLRCTLPVSAEPLPSRGFRPGVDDEAVLAVNNRAFHDHPDQGGWSLADFRANFDEPWFDPDGLRVHERGGRVIGFCWTKVHHGPDLGEIYVIGIDPDFHGQRLGVPMTAAGLHWLSDHGLDTGMLYVEADNAPALRTYERLGFVRFRTDRAWARALG